MSDSGGVQQGFPQMDTPVLEEGTGFFTRPWYRLLASMWQRQGGGRNVLAQSTFGQALPGSQHLMVFNALTGEPVSDVPVSFRKLVPGPQQNLPINTSPWPITMTTDGMLVISDGGQVELRRPPAAAVIASLSGGSFFLLEGDELIVTWFRGTPRATLFPFTVQ